MMCVLQSANRQTTSEKWWRIYTLMLCQRIGRSISCHQQWLLPTGSTISRAESNSFTNSMRAVTLVEAVFNSVAYLHPKHSWLLRSNLPLNWINGLWRSQNLNLCLTHRRTRCRKLLMSNKGTWFMDCKSRVPNSTRMTRELRWRPSCHHLCQLCC